MELLSDFLPRKFPVRSKQSLERPFFIFGSGRNGSTLLNRILNGHSELFLPSEQYFLGNSIAKFKIYNWLLWRDLVKVIVGELMPSTGSHTWQFSGDEVFQGINQSTDKSLEWLIDYLFRSYGEREKAFKRWGDTTPMNTHYLPEIWSVFPHASYVFLIRDGRDVADSYQRGGAEFLGDLAQPEKAITHWQESIKAYDWLNKKTTVHLIQYEQLVREPKQALSELCEFIGVSFEEQMLNFYQHPSSAALYQEPQHANLQHPINDQSINKWKERFDEDDSLFSTVQKELKRFGYL